ncbi:MAG: Gfo/Idh/MocA family protein [Saccharofermentanales bacterium]|jgi:UDP-N-acetyl-2-amino-2-deoxyglucuronate dehydrogenase
MEKVRFGIIGAGMAGPLNAGALKDIPDAELVACCDINQEVALKFSKQFEIPHCYFNYNDLLNHKGLDAVCVVTPPSSHEEIVIAASLSGKHVMCEKPISINCISADRMIEACRSANVKFGVISMYRFMDQAQLIKDTLDKNRLGKLISIDCSGKCYRSDQYYASGAWRGTWEGEGGGSLISQTIHFIDLMLYFAGDVNDIYGRYMTTIHSNIEVDDIANASFKFKNGAIGTLQSGTSIRPGYPRYLEIHGEKGTIKLVEESIVEWKVDGDKEEHFISSTPVSSGDTATKAGYNSTENHRRQLLDFIEAIQEDREPAVNGHEGRRTLEFIRAIYQSSDKGIPIKFPIVDKSHYGGKNKW